MENILRVDNLAKEFTLHTQGGTQIPVFDQLNFSVQQGECVALHGPSGSGKSTLLRSLYANYKPLHGTITVMHQGDPVDMVHAEPRQVLMVRKHTIGYVSQFLRVIPRVSTLDIVAEPLITMGEKERIARDKAKILLTRLRIPENLWHLAPATFSGGEQQRVNIARGFVKSYPVLLLDEPTASLDVVNQKTVIELILEAKEKGSAVIGIFHDKQVRDSVSDKVFDMQSLELLTNGNVQKTQ